MGKDALLAKAKKQAEQAKNAWSDVYKAAKEDLAFLSDNPESQWDTKVYQDRVSTGRPVVNVDQLSQFVNQVVNDIRMNTPTIKCIPHVDTDAETAEMLDGLIKDIEYESGADEAYDTAAMFQVKSSLGFIRVDHDYENQKDFNQSICIKRVVNPQAILIDHLSIEIDGSDARYGFVFDTMNVEDFKREYPKKDAVSFVYDGSESKTLGDKDEICIAEYFVIEEEKKLIGEEGETIEGEPEEGKKSRTVTKRKVRRYKLSGADVLSDTYCPGEYIPIVPVYGQEAWEDGKRRLHSLIRKGKSPQKMFNLWKSLETEILQKQPMAPVTAYTGQTENYSDDWLNPSKAGVLRHEPVETDSGTLLPPPQRLMPPSFPVGFSQASRSSVDDLKGSLGMYNASIGQRSNETSGVAIAQRKQEGDVATFHFGDNLVKSITQVGRIIVSAIPEVYDTPRVVRSIDNEDNPKIVGINGAVVDGQERSYDLTKGQYSVRVITGPAFTTQRQEAAAFYSEVATKFPQLMQIAGDLMFQYADVPGSQAIAKRLKKTIPPQLMEGEDGEEQPDAEKIQLKQLVEQGQQALTAMQQEMSALQQKVDSKEGDLAIKAEAERNDTILEMEKLRLEEKKIDIEAEFKSGTLTLKDREIALREVEMALRQQEMRQRAADESAAADMPGN